MRLAISGAWRERFFAFRGRLSRLEFWRTWFATQVFVCAAWVLGLFVTLRFGRLGALVLAPAFAVYAVALSSCVVRRLHDRGRSGWWLVPFFVGPILLNAAAMQLLSSTALALAWTGVALSLTALGANIWLFVEVGVRGTRSANAYGATA